MKVALAKFKSKQIHRSVHLASAVQLVVQLRLKKALRSSRIFHSKYETYPWSRDGVDESEILG
jgi:hypothetical protein